MSKELMALLNPVIPHFQMEGDLVNADQIERGHINKTYVTTVDHEGSSTRYVHQWINKTVFPDPPRLMDNISRVVGHLLKKRGVSPSQLQIVPDKNGLSYFIDPEGEYWRTYFYVENSVVYDVVPNKEVAYKAAVTFGDFLNDLADLDASQLHVTLPNFHNTPWRLERFEEALASANLERKEQAIAEINELYTLCHLAPRLQSLIEEYPETLRVTHNDTKVNNVLFSKASGEGLCVIDLDTVMPGSALFDIGDLVRTATNTGEEDAQDLSTVEFDYDKFEAIIEGFSETIGDTLIQPEWDAIPYAGAVMTYQCGVRFLTDFLNGDVYFKTHYPEHNLVRAKCQFHLCHKMLERLEDAQQFVNEIRPD